MVYSRILFNNIKEYTPTWMKTIPHRAAVRPNFARRPMVQSGFIASAQSQAFLRFFQKYVQKNTMYFQVFIFLLSFGMSNIYFLPLLSIYQGNNSHRQLGYHLEREREYIRKQEELEALEDDDDDEDEDDE